MIWQPEFTDKTLSRKPGAVHRRRPAAIERGIAGPGLLARVLTGKYCEYLPLYRQSEIFARQGVELSRALLSNWVDACCQLMTPLNDALYRHVMNTRELHTDYTPVKVLAPGLKKTKTGRIWTYVRDDHNAGSSSPPAVWFAYSPNRQGIHPGQHLRPFRGILQAVRSPVTTGCSVQNVKVVR